MYPIQHLYMLGQSRHQRITERCGLKGTFKGHLVQLLLWGTVMSWTRSGCSELRPTLPSVLLNCCWGLMHFCKYYLLWDFWEKNTGIEEPLLVPPGHLKPQNTSMAVEWLGTKAIVCFLHLFFSLLADTSGVSYPLIFHTAGNAEVQEGAAQCSCVTDALWAQPVALVCSHRIRDIVTPSIKACHEHCAAYPGTSTTARATTYPAHLQFLLEVTFKNISVWSWTHSEKGQCPCYSFWLEAKKKWLFDNSSNSVWTRELDYGILPSCNASFQ